MAFGRCTSAFESLGMSRHRLMMAWSRWGCSQCISAKQLQSASDIFRWLGFYVFLWMAVLFWHHALYCHVEVLEDQLAAAWFHSRYEWQLRLELYDLYAATFHIYVSHMPCCYCWQLAISTFRAECIATLSTVVPDYVVRSPWISFMSSTVWQQKPFHASST